MTKKSRINEFPKGLPASIFNLRLNEVSGAIETPTGCHVFKLIDRVEPNAKPLDSGFANEIERSVRQDKLADFIKARFERWKKEKKINYFF